MVYKVSSWRHTQKYTRRERNYLSVEKVSPGLETLHFISLTKVAVWMFHL